MILEEFFDDNGLTHPTTNNTEKEQLGLKKSSSILMPRTVLLIGTPGTANSL